MLYDVTIAQPKLDELGISCIQSHRWQATASIPNSRFATILLSTQQHRAAQPNINR